MTVSASQLAADSPPKIMKVAFVMNDGANVIDMIGPWEVFQDAMVGENGFELFTVSESTKPVTMTGGLQTIPKFSFADAPHPDIVVIGAQKGSPGLNKWLQDRAKDSRVVMSICTGAFKLADAGLLDGKKATTHHDYWDEFAKKFPKVELQREQPLRGEQRRHLHCGGANVGDRSGPANCREVLRSRGRRQDRGLHGIQTEQWWPEVRPVRQVFLA